MMMILLLVVVDGEVDVSMTNTMLVVSVGINGDVMGMINDVVACGAVVEIVACCVGVVTESVESGLSLEEAVVTTCEVRIAQ